MDATATTSLVVVQALGPLATLLAALVAGTIAWVAFRERRLADRRSEWWDRAQWALTAALSPDLATRELGLGVLGVLANSELAGREEAGILRVATLEELSARPRAAAPAVSGVAEPAIAGREHRIRVRAAQLRVATDRVGGVETASWIKDLAATVL